ncbi:CDP-glycerol glycerophosphotransferase family protein [Bacillus sp. AGMB 02131]|uniref:CDP-glycerol glycerophosphotransferase family protein n=1 Tax=Peribacillus faecalis TaxID=2772559 RepID=A0A927CU83_9BACI|nr:CDP-glycerol glycerophosphotransferase family protein [Peribacillus faecalis]MBD3107141.1 CDP-glycerol glycerophosphotransferase family protein [Peribacillus faecalis]
MRDLLKKVLPHKIIRFMSRLKQGNFFYFFWLFPIQKNKIVIYNYTGKGYGDNGKYLIEEIINQGKNFDIVWLTRKEIMETSNFPSQIRVINHRSIKALYELATAKIWIDNCRKTYYPPKRNQQFYIQTWHGGIALKKIERDAEKQLPSSYIECAKQDSKMADLFISNSNFCTNLYNSAFWYNGKILECGSPRCDILLKKDNGVVEKVKRHFNINKDTNILMYAPTFRDHADTKLYKMDFAELIKVLKKKFGGQWKILVRLHPNISSKDNFMKYTSEIINATNYDDMYELLAASNILITDYSSTMFEFSFTKKPVFLFAPDIESYIEERNFYFDIHSLPYPVVEGNNELFNTIVNFDEKKYLSNLTNFLVKLNIFEQGTASIKVVRAIEKLVEGEL